MQRNAMPYISKLLATTVSASPARPRACSGSNRPRQVQDKTQSVSDAFVLLIFVF
jgi:hypothetical protein